MGVQRKKKATRSFSFMPSFCVSLIVFGGALLLVEEVDQ
jgi:hypothetical protein